MNIFVLDSDVKKCAEYHCDKHVVKMVLEYAQMLSTTVRMSNNVEVGYKPTHKNHPCTIWARQSLSNWRWLRELAHYVNEEYKYRYDKSINHKSYEVIMALPEPNIPDLGLTEFPQAMPDDCKQQDAVSAYRNYYIQEKSAIATWKKGNVPSWYVLP